MGRRRTNSGSAAGSVAPMVAPAAVAALFNKNMANPVKTYVIGLAFRNGDPAIGVLNSMAQSGGFAGQGAEDIERLITLNVTALTRLAAAVAPRFAQSGTGAIVNIGSVVGFAPELGMTIYGATKAFVLYLSQGLHLELAPKGVYVKAVLPAATRSASWERACVDVDTLPEVMEVDELVDAALVGFDRRELITIPPLHVAGRWDALDDARRGLMSDIRQAHAAERYRPQA